MANNLNKVRDTAEEYIIMWDNGVVDGEYSKATFMKETSLEKVYDYVISEAPKECKFAGMNLITRIIQEVREEYDLV